MKKTALLTLTLLCLTTPVSAQTSDLFPELRGHFKPAATAPKVPVKTANEPDVKKAMPYTAPKAAQAPQINLEANQRREGNIKLKVTNLKGVLPYARNYSYCFADVELTNGTNQALQQLQVTLTYQGTENNLGFGGVAKGQKQVRKLMMNGPECASILSMPKLDFKSCVMENQSGEACEKRVQFSSPNEQ